MGANEEALKKRRKELKEKLEELKQVKTKTNENSEFKVEKYINV